MSIGLQRSAFCGAFKQSPHTPGHFRQDQSPPPWVSRQGGWGKIAARRCVWVSPQHFTPPKGIFFPGLGHGMGCCHGVESKIFARGV
jgi:hypothetical protein